jgi:hypothetical protein
VAFAIVLGVVTLPAWAAQTRLADIALDSELRLFEQNDFGSYSRYSIVLKIRYGEATLSIDKDGKKANLAVPLAECQALWRRILHSGLETLTDSPPETLPDQSHFTVRYRIVDQEGGFEAHSVDENFDPRYRYIVEELLIMGDSHLALANRGKQQRDSRGSRRPRRPRAANQRGQ